MNIELLQEEAMASASVSLSAMLQRPDQLEKVKNNYCSLFMALLNNISFELRIQS